MFNVLHLCYVKDWNFLTIRGRNEIFGKHSRKYQYGGHLGLRRTQAPGSAGVNQQYQYYLREDTAAID